MNVYDFDGTIYKKDCSIEFYKFCYKNNKKIILAVPIQLWGLLMYLIGIYDKTKFKQCFFCFLKYIDNIDLFIEVFWKNEVENKCFNEWYIEKHLDTDVIISASPFFLVNEGAKCLKIKHVIASDVNKKNGKFKGENCRGAEKVKRLCNKFSEMKINEFYSDSLSDKPLADISENAYLIEDGKIEKWDYESKEKKDWIETIRYIFWGGVTTGINLCLFAIFNLCGVPYTISNIVTYFIAVFISYFLNRKFVFKKATVESTFLSIVKYYLIRILSISAETIVLWLFVEIIKINVYFSKVIISVAVIVSTYILNKLFVFQRQKKNNEEKLK